MNTSRYLKSAKLEQSINVVKWVDFRLDPDLPRLPRFVIDVLEGEPEIPFDPSGSSWWGASYYRVSSDSDSDSDSDSGSEDDDTVRLCCVYLDFDGKRIGPVQNIFHIQLYEGYRPVKSLEVYPLRYSENGQRTGDSSLSQRLIDRGRKFIEVATVKHMHYNGPAFDSGDDVDSPVVIDFEEARPHFKKTLRPKLDENLIISPPWHCNFLFGKRSVCTSQCCFEDRGDIIHDFYTEQMRNDEYMANLVPADPNLEPSIVLFPRQLGTKTAEDFSEFELLIMSERVFGFILSNHTWGE